MQLKFQLSEADNDVIIVAKEEVVGRRKRFPVVAGISGDVDSPFELSISVGFLKLT